MSSSVVFSPNSSDSGTHQREYSTDLDDPDGKLGSYEYMMLAIDHPELMRQRFMISCQQLVIDITIFLLMTHLLIRAIKLVISRPRAVPVWCLIVQCLLGVTFGMVALTTYVPSGAGCATAVWTASSSIIVSGFLVTICLLYQVHYVYSENNYVLYVGIPLGITHMVLCFIVWAPTNVLNTNETGCTMEFVEEFPIIRSTPDILIKLTLSAAFVYIIHKNYKRYGSKCWTMLRRDGIQYASLVILSNLTCAILVICKVSPLYIPAFFLLDCK
jgi:hypothetical protein